LSFGEAPLPEAQHGLAGFVGEEEHRRPEREVEPLDRPERRRLEDALERRRVDQEGEQKEFDRDPEQHQTVAEETDPKE
jgi:hypothetical protein